MTSGFRSRATSSACRPSVAVPTTSHLVFSSLAIHMAIGGAALVMRNPRAAEQAFLETVRLDPQMVEAWTMIVRILTAVGDRSGARAALEDALAANPSDEGLRSLSKAFGATNRP